MNNELFIESFAPLDNAMDDFDIVAECPAPLCERKTLIKIYWLVVKYAQLCSVVGEPVQGVYLDMLFYFTCKKHVSGVFLARVTHLEGKSQIDSLVTHAYCCLLSPSAYVYALALQYKCQETDTPKFRDCTIDMVWELEQAYPDFKLALSKRAEAQLKIVFSMYNLEPPLYNLLAE